MSSGGRFYWVRNRGEDFKAKGIIVVFAWVSISDVQLKDFVALCSSLGWNCLVSRADYLNPYVKKYTVLYSSLRLLDDCGCV